MDNIHSGWTYTDHIVTWELLYHSRTAVWSRDWISMYSRRSGRILHIIGKLTGGADVGIKFPFLGSTWQVIGLTTYLVLGCQGNVAASTDFIEQTHRDEQQTTQSSHCILLWAAVYLTAGPWQGLEPATTRASAARGRPTSMRGCCLVTRSSNATQKAVYLCGRISERLSQGFWEGEKIHTSTNHCAGLA